MTENKITEYKYFFHGFPAKYALAGVHDRRIWLVVADQTIAHQLRTVFSSKVSLAVFDLSSFKNYCDKLIDNSVCLSWSVPVVEYQKHDIIKRIINPSFDDTFLASGQTELSNSIPFFNFLSESSQDELQKQMMFFYYLSFIVFKKIDNSMKDLPWTEIDTEFDQTIRTIFSTELTLADIEDGMIAAANHMLGQDQLTVRSRTRAFCILRLFDKIYA